MVTILGKIYEPSGLPTTAPFKVWLVSYGTDPQSHTLYVSPSPQTVTPDPVTGEFSFDVWANVTADVPCYYRVQFDFGLQLKLSVPASETPLEFTDLIVDETVELLPGILSRVARLESTGGVVLPTQNFSLGGWVTSPPVAYDGTGPVVIPVDSINSLGLTGVIPKPLLSGSYDISLDNVLSFGSGLTGSTGSTYSGDSANTLSVDATVARRSDAAMSDPREWTASTVSQLEAETGTGIGRRAWTPVRVFQAITAWVSQYLPSATLAEAELGTGTSDLSWSPSRITALVSAYTASNGVTSVAGKVGAVTLVPADIVGLGDVTNASNLLTGSVNSALVPLAQTATKLETARAINGVLFDGSANIIVPTPNILTFGTGLVSGSFNGSSATTLSIDTGVVVQQSDSRLVDAREWSALTVTQAEAEAGTATARRAWTPQRVTQAIAAWWANSSHKVKLDSIASGAQVNTVTSVASKTGAVTLGPEDVGLGNVPNVNATVASNITTGTLPDARLGANVALLNGNNTFTGTITALDDIGGRVKLGRTTTQYVTFYGNVTANVLESQSLDANPKPFWINVNRGAASTSYKFDTTACLFPTSLIVTNTTDATSTTSAASIKTSGGIACAGDIYANKVSYTQSDVISFTPAFEGTGWAYTTQYGRYIREGRKVEFLILLSISSIGTPSGSLLIQGLPFSCLQTTFFGGVRVSSVTGLPTSGYQWCPYILQTGSIVIQYTSGSTSAVATLSTANLTTSTTIYLSGSYITAT